jgi:hypothetical protein
MSVERWVPVVGYGERYEISDLGRVRSLRGPYDRPRIEPLVMKPMRHSGGYAFVWLYPGPVAGFLHLMALEAFVGPCPRGHEACHEDGDRMNPALGNLRWDTHASNMKDKVRHGRAPRGTDVSLARLTDDAVVEIRARLVRRDEMSAIAADYGVGPTTIGAIASGLTWRHVDGEAPEKTDRLRRGVEMYCAKLTEDVVRAARRRHAAGATFTELAAEYGVSRPAIRNAIVGATWSHVTD